MNVSIEEDGWELENVVEANQYSPSTFHIPSEEERTNLRVGDRVKLIFLFPCEDDEEEFPVVQGERMWVTVREVDGTEYQGELETAPTISDLLHVGDLIRFGPEHIASIMIRKTDQRHPEYQALKNAEYKEYTEQVIQQIREFKQQLLNIEGHFSMTAVNPISALIILLRNFNADTQAIRVPPALRQVHDRYEAGAGLLATAADHFEYGMQSHDQTLMLRAQEEAEQGRILIDMAEAELKKMH